MYCRIRYLASCGCWLLLAAIAVIGSIAGGLIGFQWLSNDNNLDPEAALVDAFPRPEAVPATPADNVEHLADLAEATVARPGSLQAYLLAATDDTRNHLLSLTLRDTGYECSAVRSSWLLDRMGSAWRASCGDTLVYWIDVDDVGHLSVEAAPYGDVYPYSAPIRRQPTPPRDNGDRTLELRERR